MLNLLGMSSRILSVTLVALIVLQQPALCFQSQARSTGIRNASRTKPGYLLKDNQTTNKSLFSFDAGSEYPTDKNSHLQDAITDLHYYRLCATHASQTTSLCSTFRSRTSTRRFSVPNPTSLVLQQLRIEVREGNNITNDIQSAGVVHLSVFVHFGDGNPLEGADITFTAPRNGAGGSFSNNTSSITVMTNNGGIAAVNFNPNNYYGEFSIRVDASFATFSASTRINQSNVGASPRIRSDRPTSQPATRKTSSSGGWDGTVYVVTTVLLVLFIYWGYTKEEETTSDPYEPIVIDF